MTKRKLLGMNPKVLALAAVAGLGMAFLLNRRKVQAASGEPLRYAPSGQPLAIFVEDGTPPPVEDVVNNYYSYTFQTGGTPGGVPHGKPGAGGQGVGAVPPDATLPGRTENLAQKWKIVTPEDGPTYYDPGEPVWDLPSRLPVNPVPGAPPVAE